MVLFLTSISSLSVSVTYSNFIMQQFHYSLFSEVLILKIVLILVLILVLISPSENGGKNVK